MHRRGAAVRTRIGTLALAVILLAALLAWGMRHSPAGPVPMPSPAPQSEPGRVGPPAPLRDDAALAQDAAAGLGPRAPIEAPPIPEPAAILRGSLRDASGRACAGASIHRVARPAGYAGSVSVPDPAWSSVLGETAGDGAFAVPLGEPLGEAEWLEFSICAIAFARYRPRDAGGDHALIVPALRETVVDVVGAPPDESWSIDVHPAERRAGDEPLLRNPIDVPVPSPQGELILRCRHHGLAARSSALRLPLPDTTPWSIYVRAGRHEVVDPSRVVEPGERVLFELGPVAQRILVEIVDVADRRIEVRGQIEVRGAKGWSVGSFDAGRAELRPPAGRRIEGDLRHIARLDDGETFVGVWPEAVWSGAARVTLRRGTGTAPIRVEIDGTVTEVIGVDSEGERVWLERRQAGQLDGAWWWEPVAGGVRVCLAEGVRRLWCVGDASSDASTGGHLGVAERASASAFRFAWRPGADARLDLGGAREGLRRVVLQARVPGLRDAPRDESWLTLSTWEDPDGPAALVAHRPDGVETRMLVIREVGGAWSRQEVPAVWR
jgi:hypothetical protein